MKATPARVQRQRYRWPKNKLNTICEMSRGLFAERISLATVRTDSDFKSEVR